MQLWDCSDSNPNQVWDTGYMYNDIPATTESQQSGTNACGTSNSQDSMCQTAWINDADDFCLWAPPSPGNIGDTEQEEVAWCTKKGRGTRVIPDGTLTGVHFVRTPDYVQVTGVGDFTKINVNKGDEGGGTCTAQLILISFTDFVSDVQSSTPTVVCTRFSSLPLGSL